MTARQELLIDVLEDAVDIYRRGRANTGAAVDAAAAARDITLTTHERNACMLATVRVSLRMGPVS